MEKIIWGLKWRIINWLFSGSWEGPMITFLTPIVAVTAKTVSSPGVDFFWFYIWVSLLLIPVGSLIHKECKRRMYDPTLVLKFQDTFDNLKVERKKAATAILTFMEKRDWNLVENKSDIDEVLDFMEDLAFYLYAGQIGERVVYHHFHYWFDIYHQGASSYIALKRRDNKSFWENIPNMMERLNKIEACKRNVPVSSLVFPDSDLKLELSYERDIDIPD